MTAMGLQGPRGEPVGRPYWTEGVQDWECDGMGKLKAYVPAGRPLTWRSEDLEFAAAMEARVPHRLIRIAADLSRRALGGDLRAAALAIRVVRPAGAEAAAVCAEVLPAAVAGAMLAAGLAALGEEDVTIPDPVKKTAPLFHAPPPPALADRAPTSGRQP